MHIRIQVLRDSKGQVLATFERKPGDLTSVEPEVEEGQELEEIEIPEEYVLDPDAFYKRHEKGQKR